MAHEQPIKPRTVAPTLIPVTVRRKSPLTGHELRSLIVAQERYSGSEHGKRLQGVLERFGLK